MGNPFSWDHLTTAPNSDEVFGAFPVVYLILFVLGLAASIAVYRRPRMFSSRHLLRRSQARTWATIFTWIFSLGLFFFLVRVLQVNPFGFGEWLWLWLTLLAAMVALVLLVLTVRYTAPQLAVEARDQRAAQMRGIANRRPPRRSRTRKH